MNSSVPVSRFVLVSVVENAGRWSRRVGIGIVASLVAVVALRSAAGVILDRWWFSSVTDAAVWQTKFVAQAELAVGVGLLTGAILGTSVWFALRIGNDVPSGQPRAVQRYHERMGPAHRWLLVGLSLFFSYRIGRAASAQWQAWLLFQHGGTVGESAPVAGGDIGFHLFRLPFLTAASIYLRQLVVLTAAVAAFAHVASGALWIGRRRRSSPYAIAHLAALTAALAGLQAVHYVAVQRPAIATNRVGAFDGPGYTERYLTKPGLLVASLLAVIVGFAAIWLARTGRWKPFSAALCAFAVGHLTLLVVLPAVTERFVVAPAEAQRQIWSIADNLNATRVSFGLDDVAADPLRLGADRTQPLTANLDDVPLFDSAMMVTAVQILAGTTGTRVVDVDVNSVPVDGADRLLFLAARTASRPDLPESGWVQEHLVYTHGDGVVAVPADATDDDGRPDVAELADVLGTQHDALYFGEGLDNWYAIVGTQRTELNDSKFGGTGIDLGGIGSRLVLGLAVGESQPVFSSELTSDSQLLYRRSIRERVGSLAPFLSLDGDPYPVVDNGRVTWVVDGYTTASTYPSAQFVTISGVPAASGLAGRELNYLHASVKATVDAETGETHLYRTDGGSDPIIDVWSSIFPDLLEPVDQFPERLRSQVRYPDDLWTVQTDLIGRYHVDTAEQLFNGSDRWAVSAAAATTVGEQGERPAPAVDVYTSVAGETDRFAAVRPLGPGSASNPTSTRDELAALAVADHGFDGGARLVVPLAGSGGSFPLSPRVAQSAIDANPEIARAITLLNANGSKVQFGPMSPVVVSDAIVWIRSIIVSGTGSSSAPRLYGVVAVMDGRVVIGETTAEAISGLGVG